MGNFSTSFAQFFSSWKNRTKFVQILCKQIGKKLCENFSKNVLTIVKKILQQKNFENFFAQFFVNFFGKFFAQSFS